MPLSPSPARPTTGSAAVRSAPSGAAPGAEPARAAPRPPAAGHRAGAAARPAVPWPWQASAACADLSPDVVFTKRAKIAAPALRACTACPVRIECEEAVAPADSWFDGVCGGRLWRNGRPAALTSPSGSSRV